MRPGRKRAATVVFTLILLVGGGLGCAFTLPTKTSSGRPGDTANPWILRPKALGQARDTGVIEGATRLPITVDYPNSGDDWRGTQIPVSGRMGDGQVTIESAYALVKDQRTEIPVAEDGRFEVTVHLDQLGQNDIQLFARAKQGLENEVTIKVRRIPGMALDGGIPLELRPSLSISNPAQDVVTQQPWIEVKGVARSSAGVVDVAFFVNGTAFGTAEPKRPGSKEFPFAKRIALNPGSNLITITTSDRRDQIAHRVVNVLRPSSRRADSEPLGPVRKKLAVVVGISDYENTDQISPLLYAHRDAELVAKVLRRDAGFDEVRLLVNQQATSSAIRDELFGFLAQAIAEDLVFIYFAGHGAPDPKNIGNLYLLTYDTDVDRMASTAFPMWEMEAAIQSKIHSERIILIADACHSGGIGSQVLTRGIKIAGNPSHDYLAAMASARGRLAFTAAEASELSQESTRWGEGHGVFTWTFVEGLLGKADRDANRVVSLGELIDYTSAEVRSRTSNQQHPDTAGRFDRHLPLLVLAN